MSDAPADSVPVVGIGASAGGLEAFTQVLAHLPAETGMAYVLVQHLAPAHESVLAKLLQRQAAIPVTQVSDGLRVAADHVYVIPPNTSMTLADGRLHLTPREHARHPPMPVDEFFRSLADANGHRAIGVVLSGSGADGEQGVRAIKVAGGITFAEAPGSAQYDSMPRAAIATGCVDFVLPPAEIAAQLARLSRHAYVREREAEPAQPDVEPVAQTSTFEASALPREIFRLLQRRSGVDFSQYKPGTLTRRLQRRMLLRHIDTLPEYVVLLEREPAEIDALCRDLLICVTGFFRDPAAFEALVHVGFPAMRKDRAPSSPVRVWVPGCATGEEAYSIAICLLEYLGDDARGSPPQIFATDVSEAAIATSRSGCYPASIEADVSPERLARFFVQEERGYRVSEAVRSLCVFAVQNVSSDPPFSHLDLVSCRNVLIYLQPVLQTKVLSLFHYALASTGILFLGTAESVSPSPGLFTSLDTAHRIYIRTAAPGRAPALGTARSLGVTPPTPRLATGDPRAAGFPELAREADQIVLAHYASAGVVIDGDLEIVQFRGATSAYLDPAPGAASFQLLKMVRPELRAELQKTIHTARQHAAPARVSGVPFHEGGVLHHVDLDVLPFKVVGWKGPFFVVLFEPAEPAGSRPPKATPARGRRRAGEAAHRETRGAGELQQELAAMERHLHSAADEHEAALEELRAANEEIQSSNEELRSTNEELETAKEELQSANEELTTLNAELRDRNTDLGALNDDLVNLLASIQVPVIIVGRDLRIRRYTAGADRLVNVIPTDVGRPLSDITPNIDVPDLVAMVRGVMETLNVVEREVRDDQGHWYALRIRPYKTAGQRIDGAVLVFQDIDERKRHALALDEARRYAEAIVDTVREPLVVLDGTLQVESANRAFYETFHVDPKETEGRPLFALGDGQWNIPRLRALLEEVLPAQSSVDHFEVEHTFRGIGHKIMLLSARELHINHGHARLVLLAIEDMTQERQLVHRAHFLAEAGVVLGASVDYEAVLHRITSLAVPELADWCIVDVTRRDGDSGGEVHRAAVAGPAPAEAERVRQVALPVATTLAHPLIRVLQTGEPLLVEQVPASMATTLVGGDGEAAGRAALTPRSVVIVPLVASGRVLGALTLLTTGPERRYTPTDLTLAEDFAHRAALALENATLYRAASVARTAADAANQAKTEFLATMSHELRTPLNAIAGYAELIEMGIYGPITDAQRAALLSISRSEQHLLGLINNVLNFAKLEAGQVTLAIEDMSASDLLATVEDMIAPQMAAKQLNYQAGACDPALIIRVDPEKARQILLNLLTNALKFTDAGGSVRTECEGTAEHVVVRIRDTGRGIQADRLEAIFEPFMQVNPSLTGPSLGVGLGLAISRDLARAMGGDLTAESTVGVGSTFTLRLPRAATGDDRLQPGGEPNARA
ncbi:MAG TPA: chemotaxis protein CheB [Gemmatimonadaceae bacterium]|nr:chemotaxis protein CheB [Gemmatimonadaceae bacterium]